MFRDETGKVSASRVLAVLWTLFMMGYLAVHLEPTPAVLTFLASIETSFVCWAGGPRLAEYLAPQIGRIGDALAKTPWRKERDSALGIEPTPTK